MKSIVILVVIAFLTACTWVKLDEGGGSVSVLNPDEAESCKAVGKVTAISRAKVAGVTRNENKLALELETIARNEAASMEGDSIVPMGDITGNERDYRVYQCP
jgi:hypothetical protein